MKKLGQEPAFPNGMEVNNEYGMSKRFYVACAAMQGMIANPTFKQNFDAIGYVAKYSWILADEFISQEDLVCEDISELLRKNLKDTVLTNRSINCLANFNIHTVRELIGLDKEQLLRINNLGPKCKKEIINFVESNNLDFLK